MVTLCTLLLCGVREIVGFGVSQPGFEQQSCHFLGVTWGEPDILWRPSVSTSVQWGHPQDPALPQATWSQEALGLHKVIYGWEVVDLGWRPGLGAGVGGDPTSLESSCWLTTVRAALGCLPPRSARARSILARSVLMSSWALRSAARHGFLQLWTLPAAHLIHCLLLKRTPLAVCLCALCPAGRPPAHNPGAGRQAWLWGNLHKACPLLCAECHALEGGEWVSRPGKALLGPSSIRGRVESLGSRPSPLTCLPPDLLGHVARQGPERSPVWTFK